MTQMSKEYMKEYYQRNKERYARYNYSMYCEACSTLVPRSYWLRHCRTAKHKGAVASPRAVDINAVKHHQLCEKLEGYKAKVKKLLSKIKMVEADLGLRAANSAACPTSPACEGDCTASSDDDAAACAP